MQREIEGLKRENNNLGLKLTKLKTNVEDVYAENQVLKVQKERQLAEREA